MTDYKHPEVSVTTDCGDLIDAPTERGEVQSAHA